jgi:hypothetical protein
LATPIFTERKPYTPGGEELDTHPAQSRHSFLIRIATGWWVRGAPSGGGRVRCESEAALSEVEHDGRKRLRVREVAEAGG